MNPLIRAFLMQAQGTGAKKYVDVSGAFPELNQDASAPPTSTGRKPLEPKGAVGTDAAASSGGVMSGPLSDMAPQVKAYLQSRLNGGDDMPSDPRASAASTDAKNKLAEDTNAFFVAAGLPPVAKGGNPWADEQDKVRDYLLKKRSQQDAIANNLVDYMQPRAAASQPKPLKVMTDEEKAALDASTNLKNAQAEALTKKTNAPPAPKGAPKMSKDATELRKEFNQLPETKDYMKVAVAFDKIKRAATTPSAAGDLNLIFGYMKMLDPGSTVREGEFANAQNAGGVGDKVISTYNRLVNGERLSPEQRAEFLRQAEDLHGAQRSNYDTQAQRYRDLAKKYGMDPDDVTGAGSLATPGAVAGAPSKSTSAPVEPPKTRVLVSNGKETREIDISDLPDAEKDNYRRVK